MIAYKIMGCFSGLCQCYGSVDAVIRLAHAQINPEPFTGLRLYFNRKVYLEEMVEERQYGGYNNYKKLMAESVPYGDIWDTLEIARSLGFGKYLKSNTETIYNGYVDFPADTPFIVVVAMTGFFRWFDNHRNFLKIYRMIHKKMMNAHAAGEIMDAFGSLTPRPFAVPIFLAANALTFGNRDSQSWANVCCHTHGTHSVVPSQSFTIGGMTTFASWPYRLHQLESMEDELKRTGELSYEGRDTFFAGTGTLYNFSGGNPARDNPHLNLALNLAYAFWPEATLADRDKVRRPLDNPINPDKMVRFLSKCHYGEEAPCLMQQ